MSKRVVVIGGGIAGLAAAADLLRQDCEVTLLEAKPRLGGRIYTVRDGDLVMELGAEFLHGQNASIQTALQAAGLSTREVSMRNDVFEGGKLRREDVWGRMSEVIRGIDTRRPDNSFAAYLENGTFRERTRQLATAFVNGFHAARTEAISAHSLRRAQHAAEHAATTKQSRIDIGYSALIHFLADDIRSHGGNILLNAAAKRIEYQPGHVEMRVHHDGHIEDLTADAAVITVSLGVLKAGSIEFDPPLTEKREAIDQLQFGNVIKVALVFMEQCWPDFAFIQAWDELLPTWWTDSRAPVLTGWAGGPQADALAHLSAGNLEKLALNTLKKIFPQQADELQAGFICSHTYDWARDPFIRGAYSFIPVNGLDLPRLLAAPVADTLFFAGEATVFDAQTGIVSSTYESGLRAAREAAATLSVGAAVGVPA